MTRAIRVISSALLLTSPAVAQFNSVRVEVIDLGQGDGILIRTPNQKWVVIDAGSDSGLCHATVPERTRIRRSHEGIQQRRRGARRMTPARRRRSRSRMPPG